MFTIFKVTSVSSSKQSEFLRKTPKRFCKCRFLNQALLWIHNKTKLFFISVFRLCEKKRICGEVNLRKMCRARSLAFYYQPEKVNSWKYFLHCASLQIYWNAILTFLQLTSCTCPLPTKMKLFQCWTQMSGKIPRISISFLRPDGTLKLWLHKSLEKTVFWPQLMEENTRMCQLQLICCHFLALIMVCAGKYSNNHLLKISWNQRFTNKSYVDWFHEIFHLMNVSTQSVSQIAQCGNYSNSLSTVW